MTSQDQSVVQPLKKQVWTVGSCVKQQVDQPFLKVANRLLQYCNEIVGFKHETTITNNWLIGLAAVSQEGENRLYCSCTALG